MVSPLMCGPQLFSELSLNIMSIQTNTITQLREKIGNDLIDDIRPKIWTRMPFLGKQGGFLVGLKRFYRKYSVISQKRRSNLL